MKTKNFDDLVSDRRRLEAKVEVHRQELRSALQGVSDTVNPLSDLAKWTNRAWQGFEPGAMVSAGTNAGIDLVVRDKILSNAHWSIRIFVPFLMKRIFNLVWDHAQKNTSEQDLHKNQ